MWLVTHQPWLKQTALRDILTQRRNLLAIEDKLFYDDIESEFEQLAKQIINVELSKSTGLSIEDCKLTTDDLNIKEYLK